jgi:hypothetical protein
MLMDNFAAGVQAHGDEIVDFRDNRLPDQHLDAGFVLGYTLEDNFRKKIIDQLRLRKTPAVFVDSNILHYARSEHEWHRYSLGTVYPDSGTYFFQDLDQTKWQRFSDWHNAPLRPWRTTGNHILILCQRPKGFNMFLDQDAWLEKTVHKIRKHTQRPIMIRMHPGDGTRFKQIEKIQKRYGTSVVISEHANIRDALVNCWCTVGINSTPNVVAAIEGVPGYVEDPRRSWAADVAFTDLAQIENPVLPDRTDWTHKIANIHWSNQEVVSGQLWSAIKQYISSAR